MPKKRSRKQSYQIASDWTKFNEEAHFFSIVGHRRTKKHFDIVNRYVRQLHISTSILDFPFLIACGMRERFIALLHTIYASTGFNFKWNTLHKYAFQTCSNVTSRIQPFPVEAEMEWLGKELFWLLWLWCLKNTFAFSLKRVGKREKWQNLSHMRWISARLEHLHRMKLTRINVCSTR